jgi:hypothetical protein
MASFYKTQPNLGIETLDIIIDDNVHVEAVYCFDFDGELEVLELLAPVGNEGSEICIKDILSADVYSQAFDYLESILKADYENRVLECQITRWERLND